MSWGSKRQLLIIFSFIIILGIGLGVYYFLLVRIPTGCTDKVQNEGELGIDCGGPCDKICSNEIIPLSVEWKRVFKTNDGKYDAAALVVNKNNFLGIPAVGYMFSLKDSRGVFVTEKSGSIFINPNEKVLIFETGFSSGNRIVSKAEFEFDKEKDKQGWVRVKDTSEKPKLTVEDEAVTESDNPKISANIVNNSPYDIYDIAVPVIVYDEEDNAMAVSSTYIKVLPKDSSYNVQFTWPSPFKSKYKRIDILPRVNYVSSVK